MSMQKRRPNKTRRYLFTLIHSMNKAEKRNFKLYIKKMEESSGQKLVQVFDAIAKTKTYDEHKIKEKLPGISVVQLSTLKRHLYQQILTSLRLLSIQKNIDIQIREQIDFARILYGKGLFYQSLKILERIRVIAQENHLDLLLLEILEFLKLIEERHITRSRQEKGKMERLESDALRRSEIIHNSCQLSNLKIAIHGFYIRYGHVRNDLNKQMVIEVFRGKLSKVDQTKLTFFERVYLYQSWVWYYHMLLDFEQCFFYAKKWIDVFEEVPNLIEEDPDLYLRGYHYVLTSLYHQGDQVEFKKYFKKFAKFYNKNYEGFNYNSRMIASLYFYSAEINQHIMGQQFRAGLPVIPKILSFLDKFSDLLDQHRVLIFYYKIAYLYFGMKDYEKCLDYLNKILDLKVAYLREDLQAYARILSLLAHYELGNFILLNSLIKSTHRFLNKLKELTEVQKETLRLFRTLVQLPQNEHRSELEGFREKMKMLKEDEFEKRSFIYLDVSQWVEWKLAGRDDSRKDNS